MIPTIPGVPSWGAVLIAATLNRDRLRVRRRIRHPWIRSAGKCEIALGVNMQLPSITAAYLAMLALLYAALAIRVVQLRRRNRAGFGDGDNASFAARSARTRISRNTCPSSR